MQLIVCAKKFQSFLRELHALKCYGHTALHVSCLVIYF